MYEVMSRQAQLGLFAVIALVLLFGIFYIITDFGTRHSGYRLGVHFASAAGLPTGAQVFFSGVTVGSVDEIQLLPDNSVDVILAIKSNVNIPKESKFLIQTPLTGTPNMIIVPPVPHPLPVGYVATPPPPEAIWPKRVLPLEQQPIGSASPTIADLMAEGQGEVRRLDAMVTLLQEREPRLLNSLQSTLDSVHQMTGQMQYTVSDISSTLDVAMRRASANIVDMTGTLNSTLGSNRSKIDSLMTSLDSTAVALNASMNSLRGLAQDPRLKNNLIDTTQNIAQLTGNIALLTNDLRTVTGNPQTQGELRDTVAHLDATMQKANSLLGALGGKSSVYGVDVGATPYPIPSGRNQLPPPAVGTPQPQGTPSGAVFRQRLSKALFNLAQIQLRLSYLNAQTNPGPSPVLTRDRGPQADINAVLLPSGPYAVLAGANDIGAHTTYNAAVLKNFGRGLHAGGGVLYSQIGVLASYNPGRIGAETRIYDLRTPTFDVYGNLNLTSWGRLFLGERDLTRSDRRTVFGLQLQF